MRARYSAPPKDRDPSRLSLAPDELNRFSMFEGVALGPRLEFLAAAVRRELAPGEVVIRQGEPNSAVYLVLSGELAVYLDDIHGEPVAQLGAGEAVGEMSLLDGSPASAHVIAKSATQVITVDEEAFWAMVETSHAFAISLLIKLAERLRANNATVSKSVLQRRRFERAAMFDGLTGIHNRRWLDETLHRLAHRHERDGASLSLSLIDVDHFKKFNDTYGHAAGDFVLAGVARVLASNLRPTDLVARFGGEEFVILFPQTGLADAVTASERVRAAVAATPFVMDDGAALPSVTISMGVSEMTVGQSIPDLLKAADEAMYRAKQAGRNRVMPAKN